MMQTSKKFTAYSLLLGTVMGATALLAPTAQAADLNVRLLLPDGQYVSIGDSPNNRWYNRSEYQQYGFNRYHYSARRHAYVAYDPQGNYYGHNTHGGGWHHGQGGGGDNRGFGGPGGDHGDDRGHGGPGGDHGDDHGHGHR